MHATTPPAPARACARVRVSEPVDRQRMQEIDVLSSKSAWPLVATGAVDACEDLGTWAFGACSTINAILAEGMVVMSCNGMLAITHGALSYAWA